MRFRIHAEHDSGIGRKVFGFRAESMFGLPPESCSPSDRNPVRLQTGIVFGLERNPHQPDLIRATYEPKEAES